MSKIEEWRAIAGQASLRILRIVEFGDAPKYGVSLTRSIKKFYRRTIGMIEFLPCPQSRSPTYNNEQNPNDISMNLDDSLYSFHRMDSGLLEVKFEGLAFGRNSICFGGVLFNVSTVSASVPAGFPDLDLVESFCFLIIPRQTTRILTSYNSSDFVQFIAFEFGSQLTRIDRSAFDGYQGLRSICLPRSVEKICAGAFSYCSSLALLGFERCSRLTRIDEEAFSWCESLGPIHLPASLQILPYRAFPQARASQITIEEGSRTFRISGDLLMDAAGVTVIRYYGFDRPVTLGREIETLGVECFSDCSGLLSLVFESGSKLKRIEAQALSHSGLKSICLPASVEILCVGCFHWCRSLSSLTFEPDSKLTTIEANVFRYCSSLTSLSIPGSVRKIDGSAFAHSGISHIAVEAGNAIFGICGDFLIDSTSVVRYFGTESEVTLTSDIFDSRSSLQLSRIGPGAFLRCSCLQSISIPASVESLGTECLSYCKTLSSVTFESGSKLLRIEARAFFHSGWFGLISIPASVESLGDDCFSQHKSPFSVTFESGSKLRRIGARAFRRCAIDKSIAIPASVESIGDECFSLCKSLFSVTFESGSKLLRIEARAFDPCSGLQSISIPASVESIGDGCFHECGSLSSVTFESGSKLVRIEARAFCACPMLESISIPASVESLGDECFCYCESLSSVTFDPGSKLVRIEDRAFSGSSLLKSIVIPESIRELVKGWAQGSSLEAVIFESASSLQRMLDDDCVDLREWFAIQICKRDSDIDSLGSSIGRRFKHFSHLVD
jgi:hypothetical protein